MRKLFLLIVICANTPVFGQDGVLLFPQFADGLERSIQAQTRIMLRNNGGQPLSGALRFFAPDGSPAEVQVAGQEGDVFTFELAPWGVKEVRTAGVGGLKSGFVEASVHQGDATFLKGNEIFEISGLPVSVDSAEPGNLHRLYVRNDQDEATGLALYNPSASGIAELDLVLMNGDGSIFGSSQIELPPRNQFALFVGEGALFGTAFEGLAGRFEGSLGVFVRRGPPVAVLSLIQKNDSAALSSLPVIEQSIPSYGETPEHLQVEVVAEYPHDTAAFTQGLLWHEGHVFESTGLTGHSTLRMSVLETGQVIRRVDLDRSLFGEGLALVGNRLIQLTWLAERAIFYDLESFTIGGEVGYLGQGWGLTYDQTFLIMSDGSDELTFRDPVSFAIWQTLPVTLNGSPLRRLNELEWVEGQIYANIWQQSDIVRIHPESGEVTAVVDTSALPYQPQNPADDSLNGIAYVPERGTFLLTGKRWPKLFEVRFVSSPD